MQSLSLIYSQSNFANWSKSPSPSSRIDAHSPVQTMGTKTRKENTHVPVMIYCPSLVITEMIPLPFPRPRHSAMRGKQRPPAVRTAQRRLNQAIPSPLSCRYFVCWWAIQFAPQYLSPLTTQGLSRSQRRSSNSKLLVPGSATTHNHWRRKQWGPHPEKHRKRYEWIDGNCQWYIEPRTLKSVTLRWR